MVLITSRQKSNAAWHRMKKLSYYGSLVVSAFSFSYALLGLIFPDTDISYINAFFCIVVFAIFSSISWTLKDIRGKNT